MYNNQRRSHRRPVRYTAWIALPNTNKLIGCVLNDVSDHGARLDVESIEPLPDNFFLLLSSSGKPKRKCRVVWRGENQLGVEFEKPFARADKSRAMLKAEAQSPPIAPQDDTADEPSRENV